MTYGKAFPKLADYPAMVSWLENSDDKLSDLELWGVEKAMYGFSDLFDNDGVGLKYGLYCGSKFMFLVTLLVKEQCSG